MNKKELEKMFDEAYLISDWGENGELDKVKVKDFIFETMIPEVLKSIVLDNMIDDRGFGDDEDLIITKDTIKQKAKELYGIEL